MNWKKVLIAGVVVWILSSVFGWLTCGWLFNWVYELPPNIWNEPEVIMGNMLWSALLTFVVSIVFVFVFALFYKGIPGKGVKKGIVYGFAVWLVGVLPQVSMPLFMTISTGVVVYWIISGLVFKMLYGAIAAAIYKAK